MTLQEFYDKLESHDWFFEFSDDHFVWTRGNEQALELAAEAERDEQKQRLSEEYHDHVFSGPNFGTEKATKPERPA